MKYPISIIIQNPLVRSDVSSFIHEHGGRTENEGNYLGAVHVDSGTVWFFFDETEMQRESIMELAGDQILDRFGGPYGSSVTLEASSAAGSAGLLTNLALACCERWDPAFAYDFSETLLSRDEIFRLRASGRTFLDLHDKALKSQDCGGRDRH